MTVSRRVQRVERELREIVSVFLISGVKEPLMGLVTVTRVSASPDLRHAKVFLSMMASETEKQENLEILKSSAKIVQHLISKQLPMKFCPKISFILDKGFENAELVEQRLKEIKKGSEE
ncbi:MAG: 30S ribosome-binding factor RbfA [Bdellovibrionales bacterium]|nr:30S ribosome-binding factor RbfA [Bdellovibrionales bacterium]